MVVDVEEVEGAEDPEVQRGQPNPCCSQEAQAQQVIDSRFWLTLVPHLKRHQVGGA